MLTGHCYHKFTVILTHTFCSMKLLLHSKFVVTISTHDSSDSDSVSTVTTHLYRFSDWRVCSSSSGGW